MHLCVNCIDIASFNHFSIEFWLFIRFSMLCFQFYFLYRYYSCYPVSDFLFLSVVVVCFFSFNLLSDCQFVFNLPLNIVKLLLYHMWNEISTCNDGIIKDNYMSDTNHSTNIKKNIQLSSQITEQKRPHLPMNIEGLSSFRHNHRITLASKDTPCDMPA